MQSLGYMRALDRQSLRSTPLLKLVGQKGQADSVMGAEGGIADVP
jgi:hypothetical protein